MSEKKKWESHKLHENISIKGKDLFENPSDFLKVDEIKVNVDFPTLPGIGEEIIIFFPSIKTIGTKRDYWYIQSNINKDDGKIQTDDGKGIITYKMSDIISSRKKGNQIVFENLKKHVDEEKSLESLFNKIKFKVIFDNNIWKIAYMKDKLNMKLKKIKKLK